MLDPIHNQGLILALGALKTFPVAILHMDEPSLYTRREELSLQYTISIVANPSNPAHELPFFKIVWHQNCTTFRICQYQNSKHFTPLQLDV